MIGIKFMVKLSRTLLLIHPSKGESMLTLVCTFIVIMLMISWTKDQGHDFFMNTAVFQWLYKKHLQIGASVISTNFLALNYVMDNILVLRKKLITVGVQVSGHLYIYDDNISFIHNNWLLDLTLKDKMKYTCYHAVH